MRVLLLLLLVLVPQDGDELRKKIDRVVSEETERSRAALLESLRRDLGAPPPAPPPAAGGGTLAAADALVTEDLIRKHATFLAGDALEGRAAGYPGNDKASEYLAEVFRESGLTAAGDAANGFEC